MGIAWALQWLVNLVLAMACFIAWMRLRKREQDDPKLARSFQLVQSKIAVLEDFSDSLEKQMRFHQGVLDQKIKDISEKIEEADKKISEIGVSIQKSVEVANLFEDRIPHEDVIERKRTEQYMRAAELAAQSKSVQDIAKEVDLTIPEIEFIAKVKNPNEEAQTLKDLGEKFRAALPHQEMR